MLNGWIVGKELKPLAWIGAVVIGLAVVGCQRGPRDGLTKYPVHGKVLINGAPQAGIVIRFVLQGEDKLPSNGGNPVGITDAKGEFLLSTNGVGDGAVAGDYAITFLWPERKEPPVGDRFNGAYSRAADPPYKGTVIADKNELGTFELELKSEAAPDPAAEAERKELRDPNR